jgi:DNA-binding transcriptional MocR family regulator
MPVLHELSTPDLQAYGERVRERHAGLRSRNLMLDITRGKPAPEQLDLSNALLTLPGAGGYAAADGSDSRNYYGGVRGVPEARALFAPMLGAPAEQVLIAGNSSLALMHDAIVYGLLSGVCDSETFWSAQGPITFLCPSPGYDRHFAICEAFGIRMIAVPMTGHGPDVDIVERLVADDPGIKGMWCVPKYSNPTGEIYAPETIRRLAAMPTAAGDFRLFWDNAYAAHHLTETSFEIDNILDACARHGHANRPFVFASTSKMTFAGGGLAMFAASKPNLDWFAGHMGRRTIGPDKLNQLRHVRLLRDAAGIATLMAGHRRLLAPKFDKVQSIFSSLLGGLGVASWSEPKGGYFISLDVLDGCAKQVVTLAAAAGIALVPAGSTFPYGRDPNDRNIRIAPSHSSLDELAQAAEGIALCVLLAATDALLAKRTQAA